MVDTDLAGHATARADRGITPFEELARPFAGTLLSPDDPQYDQYRRVWNGSIDRRPALIARCTSDTDVANALRAARKANVPIAIRGGGHSFPGFSTCDGGVVIDLGPLKGIHVDPDAGVVRVQAGVLLGELDRATQAHAMAVPLGAVSHTGVAGLTLGGGIGWLMRKHGLTIDQLRAVNAVSVDGERLRASATENPDLFWAIRGGGGNFAVVTEFEFALHPVGPSVLAGLALWSLERGEDVMRRYRDWCADMPDELTTAITLRRAPATELLPREIHGRHVVALLGCWSGRPEAGEQVLRAMRSFGPPLFDAFAHRPFVEFQSMLDTSYPHGLWAYVRSCDVDELSDEIVGVSLEHGEQIASPRSAVTIWQLGGAVSRGPAEDTAFGDRSSGHIFNVTGATESADGFDREREWTRGFAAALSAHRTGVYVNFLMDEGDHRVRAAYGAERYNRLRAVKRKFDPENVLRLNQNIAPED